MWFPPEGDATRGRGGTKKRSHRPVKCSSVKLGVTRFHGFFFGGRWDPRRGPPDTTEGRATRQHRPRAPWPSRSSRPSQRPRGRTPDGPARMQVSASVSVKVPVTPPSSEGGVRTPGAAAPTETDHRRPGCGTGVQPVRPPKGPDQVIPPSSEGGITTGSARWADNPPPAPPRRAGDEVPAMGGPDGPPPPMSNPPIHLAPRGKCKGGPLGGMPAGQASPRCPSHRGRRL